MSNLKDLFLLGNEKIDFRFSWANVALYIFFLVYGYFGAHVQSFSSIYNHIVESAIVLIPFSLFAILLSKNLKRFDDVFFISKMDFYRILFLFILFFLLSWERLNYSLFIDEIAYAGVAHGHSLYISYFLAQYFLGSFDIEFSLIVRFVSLGLLGSLVVLFLFIRNLEWKNKAIIIAVAIIICRVVFTLNGGNESPHPPLHLVPLFVFGSIFGVSDTFFKFSCLFVYVAYLFIVFKLLTRVLSEYLSIATVIAIGSFPLLLEMSTVVEHSNWAYFIFTLVMLEIVTNDRPSFLRLIALVSIGVLMRQPVLLALVPVVCLQITNHFGRNFDFKRIVNQFFLYGLFLIFVPFFVWSLIHGTPAMESVQSDSFLSFRFKDALNSGVIINSIINVIPFFWIAVFPFAFFSIRNKFHINGSFILFFFVVVLVYYSINPGLWGYAKYQEEIFAPFSIVGFVNILIFLSTYFSLTSLIVLSLLISATNLSNFGDRRYLHVGAARILFFHVNLPLYYSKAYQVIKQQGLAQNCFSIGPTYGVFPEIMNGYSISELLAAKNIFDNLGREDFYGDTESSIRLVNSDNNVKVVLVGMLANQDLQDSIVAGFVDYGWVPYRKIFDDLGQVSIDIVVRNKID